MCTLNYNSVSTDTPTTLIEHRNQESAARPTVFLLVVLRVTSHLYPLHPRNMGGQSCKPASQHTRVLWQHNLIAESTQATASREGARKEDKPMQVDSNLVFCKSAAHSEQTSIWQSIQATVSRVLHMPSMQYDTARLLHSTMLFLYASTSLDLCLLTRYHCEPMHPSNRLYESAS